MEKTFGNQIQIARRQKGLTVKAFIDRLGIEVSPAYITKIEIHGEIPRPSLICKMAEILELQEDELLDAAKENKIREFKQTLTKKYQQAVGLYMKLKLQNRKLYEKD